MTSRISFVSKPSWVMSETEKLISIPSLADTQYLRDRTGLVGLETVWCVYFICSKVFQWAGILNPHFHADHALIPTSTSGYQVITSKYQVITSKYQVITSKYKWSFGFYIIFSLSLGSNRGILNLCKPESPFPADASYQIWLKSV